MKYLMQQNLLEKIYAAALCEISWEQCIPYINQLFQSTTGGFFIQDDSNGKYHEILMLGFADGVMERYEAYYKSINPWFDIPGMMAPNIVRTEADIEAYRKQRGYFAKTEFFNDWMRPYEMEHAIGGSLTTRGALHLNFTMFRPAEIGSYRPDEIKQLQQLFPHLRRAMEVNHLVKTARSHHAMLLEGMDKAGIGMALLDGHKQIAELNRFAEKSLTQNDGLAIHNRQIYIAHPQNRHTWESVLFNVYAGLGSAATDWISIGRPSQHADYQMMLIPINSALSPFSEPAIYAMLLIIDPTQRLTLPRHAIQQKLSLTERETDIAICLLQGKSAKQIALALDLSYETTRWYIKQLCQKSSCHTQTEFIASVLNKLVLIF